MVDGPHGSFAGRAADKVAVGGTAAVYVRPEAVTVSREPRPDSLKARADRIEFEGAVAMLHATSSAGQSLLAAIPNQLLAQAPVAGETVWLSFAPNDALVLAHA
jgi:spermidine/putrescine transport system ATP-binding protein